MTAASGHARTLLLAAALTVLLWQLPFGPTALYPFTLLATYAHELGHGLTALLLGGEFDALRMFPDGSGVAEWRGDVGRLGRGLVAAGGLVGPSVAGALLLVASRRVERARPLLALLGASMLLSALFFARGLFAPLFVIAVGLVLLALALRAPRAASLFTLQLVAVQLCLAVFRDLDYMFSEGGIVGGERRLSDSGAIAEALFLPYWFWGALTAAFSFAVLAAGLFFALRPERARASAGRGRRRG
jgi:hypothetical protein